jgi:hypothetical protein
MSVPPVLAGLLFHLLLVLPSVAAAQPATGLFPQAAPDIARAATESLMGKDRAGKDGPMAKVGPDLILTFHEYRDYQARGGLPKLKQPFKPSLPLMRVTNGFVVVDAVAGGDVKTLAHDLQALGMQGAAISGRLVSGRLPIAALESAAHLPSLRFARPAYAATRTGTVTSQGDAAMLADVARTTYGADGSGVMVGTLSDSYNCLAGAAGDVASNDLPAGVQVLQEEAGCASGTDEGRAMMQIVHDVAPGAAQAFHSAFNGEADFALGILELAITAGATVINDDVIYFAEPMFQDGLIAQAIDAVKALGVAYFSAAGNQRRESYEDTFRNSGQPGYFLGSTRHDFNPGGGTDGLQQVTIPGNTQVVFVLQWDDPYYSVSGGAGADTDLDIILYSSGGQAKAGGTADNILSGDPVEVFGYVTSPGPTETYQIGIEHYAGPFPSKVKYVYFGDMTVDEDATNSGTAYGHPTAAGARAVGAARYTQTPAFGQSPPLLEYFSSAGGVEILFDTSGNPVSELRQKPEIVAPDGGDTTFFYPGQDYEPNGYPNFFGTSAAAPHAAGVAALLKDYEPSLTPDEIYAALQTTAIDMDAPGVDFDSGYGLIQATAALASLSPDADGDGVADGVDNCPNAANPLQENNDADVQGDACDPDDDNDTLTDLDEINVHGTNPLLADSDGDGFTDPVEIAAGSDPVDAGNIPGSASGDINGDGHVDVVDVLLGFRILSGDLEADTNQILRGDVAPLVGGVPAPDGQFTAGDVSLIMGKASGEFSF